MKKAAAVTKKKETKTPEKKAAKLTPKMAKKLEPASIEEPVTMAPRDMEADLNQVVVAAAKAKGSTPVTWKRILEILGLPAFVEEREWGLKIFDTLIDRGIVEKGVLKHDAEETKRILAMDLEAIPQGTKFKPIDTATTRLITVPIEAVVVCPLNPRKRIPEGSIDEMADSILEHDIVQPPVARPGKYQDTYEVVFGQRRLLGKRLAIEKAKVAKRPMPETIQLLVREMDDRTVLEEAWVENLQRVDVGAREEVEGFQAMLNLRDDDGNPIYSISSLAQKIGKAKSYVSNRIRIAGAPEEMWQALEAGVIGLRHLIEVGRLPDPAARKQAAAAVLKPRFKREGEVLTVSETIDLIRDEYMVSLRGCPWKLDDEELVPVVKNKKGERVSGGACADCPCRAGSDPELKEALSGNQHQGGKQGLDANSCMLPACYKAKQEAYWLKAKVDAAERGSKVLTPEEAQKIFAAWGSGLPLAHTGLVSLSQTPTWNETGHHAGEETLPTWGEMIKKVDPQDVTVGRSELTGEIHYLLPREKAIELAEEGLKKKGKDSPFANRPGAKNGDDDDDDGEESQGPSEWEIKREREKRLQEALNAKLREAVDLQKTPSEEVITELVLGTLWEDLNYNGSGLMALLSARGLPDFEDETGDDEAARAYLDGVVKPEIERAPYAWAALALFEIYDQFNRADEPLQTAGLFKALGLDREAILAAEEPTETEA